MSDRQIPAALHHNALHRPDGVGVTVIPISAIPAEAPAAGAPGYYAPPTHDPSDASPAAASNAAASGRGTASAATYQSVLRNLMGAGMSEQAARAEMTRRFSYLKPPTKEAAMPTSSNSAADPIRQWNSGIAALEREGMSRTAAVRTLRQREPQLYGAMLRAHNLRHNAAYQRREATKATKAAGGGDAIAEFEGIVNAKQAAGMSRAEAFRSASVENPEKRRAYVDAYNARRRRS